MNEYNECLTWRDRLYLASDELTNDLGYMHCDDAELALEYIEGLERKLNICQKALEVTYKYLGIVHTDDIRRHIETALKESK